MAKKSKKLYDNSQTFMRGSFTTPKCQCIWPSLDEKNKISKKYEISTLVEDTPEWNEVINSLIEFQNKCLEQNGEGPVDELLCLKDVVAYNEEEEDWEPNGESRLIFKSAESSKFRVVGPNRKDIDPEKVSGGATGGDIVRVNGTAAFGYFGKEPYVTLYINAVQWIEGNGPSGVSAFDDETGGEDEQEESEPFEDEAKEVDHDAIGDLA